MMGEGKVSDGENILLEKTRKLKMGRVGEGVGINEMGRNLQVVVR